MRLESINVSSFYYDQCTVDVDSILKQQFKTTCEVLFYIPKNSIKEEKHQEVYDAIT